MAKAQHRMEIQTYKRDKVKIQWKSGRYEVVFGGQVSKFAILLTDDQLAQIVEQYGREQARVRLEKSSRCQSCNSF